MQSRREFHARLIGSAITFGLVEMLWARDLFAEPVKPTIDLWFRELTDMTKDLNGRKLTDIEFQSKMEELYKRVDLKALCSLVKLDEIETDRSCPARPTPASTLKVEGLPANVWQADLRLQGESIVRGHANMCTGHRPQGKWRPALTETERAEHSSLNAIDRHH